jgi:hypothetical protein
MSTVTRPASVLSYGKRHLAVVVEEAMTTMTTMNTYLNFLILVV